MTTTASPTARKTILVTGCAGELFRYLFLRLLLSNSYRGIEVMDD